MLRNPAVKTKGQSAYQSLISAMIIIVIFAGWEAGCRIFAVPVYVLPTPSEIILALISDWASLLHSAWVTLSMALVALGFAWIFAIALAVLAVLSPVIDRVLNPLAVTLQVTP